MTTGFLCELVSELAFGESTALQAAEKLRPRPDFGKGTTSVVPQMPQHQRRLQPLRFAVGRWTFAATSLAVRLPKTFLRPLLPVAILFGPLLSAQDTPAPLTPITRDEVWQTVAGELRARGVPGEQLLRAEEIELPAAVPAAAGRTLRVSMVCWDADLGRAQFQLECREPGQCVPFLAYARAGRSTAMGSGTMVGSSCRSVSRPRSTPRKAIVRAGDRAMVVFRGRRLRLTALVICLERGAAGDVIRVRNQDGRIFRARVSDPALLEALPQ